MNNPAPLRFSCADFTFPLLKHDQVLDLLRLLDFEAVEIGLFPGRSHIQPEDIAGDPGGAARRLGASLRARGLIVSDVFLQTGADPSVAAANDPDAAVRKRARQLFESALEFATALGSQHLTGLPGVIHSGTPAVESMKRATAEAGWRAAIAKRAGVTYAVEAHVGSICPEPSAVLRFLEQAKGVTLTLDYGHFIAEGFSNDAVHPLLPLASHFHARGACPGRLQTSVKENTIDFAAIVKWTGAAGFDGFVCLEYVWTEWRDCNRTDNLSETILLREHLRRLARRPRRGRRPVR